MTFLTFLLKTPLALLASLLICPALLPAAQPQSGEMAGNLLVPNDKGPTNFNAGFSMYVAAWPLLREYPGSRFQTGLFGTWMFAQHEGKGPTNAYSDIEAGWAGGATRASRPRRRSSSWAAWRQPSSSGPTGPARARAATGQGRAGTEATAVLEPAGPLDDVIPGLVKLAVTDINGVKKSVSIEVSVGEADHQDCPGGQCGPGGLFHPAGAQPALVTTAPPPPSPPVTPPALYRRTLPVSDCALAGPGAAAALKRASIEAESGRTRGLYDTKMGYYSSGYGRVFPRNGSIDLNVFLGRGDFGKSAGSQPGPARTFADQPADHARSGAHS